MTRTSCLLLAILSTYCSGLALAEELKVVVAATSDLRGRLHTEQRLHHSRPPGGLAHLASIIVELRSDADVFILLDAGDFLTPYPLLDKTAPIIAAFNKLGYTAVAVGNSDLYYSAEQLSEWAKQSDFAWLSANVAYPQTPWQPSLVYTTNGLKIGIIGLTATGSSTKIAQRNNPQLQLLSPLAVGLSSAQTLQSADLRIGLFHSGSRLRASEYEDGFSNVSGMLAEQLPPLFDVVIAGHAQRLSRRKRMSYPTTLLDAGSYGRALVSLTLIMQRKADGSFKITSKTVATYSALDKPDQRIIDQAQLAKVEAKLSEPLPFRWRRRSSTGLWRCVRQWVHAALVAGEYVPQAEYRSLLPVGKAEYANEPLLIGKQLLVYDIYRFIPYANRPLLVSLNRRQFSILAQPFFDWRKGRRIDPFALLYPIENTEVEESSALVFLTDYHLLTSNRLALVSPQQLKQELPWDLKDIFINYIKSKPDLPQACRSYLEPVE